MPLSPDSERRRSSDHAEGTRLAVLEAVMEDLQGDVKTVLIELAKLTGLVTDIRLEAKDRESGQNALRKDFDAHALREEKLFEEFRAGQVEVEGCGEEGRWLRTLKAKALDALVICLCFLAILGMLDYAKGHLLSKETVQTGEALLKGAK